MSEDLDHHSGFIESAYKGTGNPRYVWQQIQIDIEHGHGRHPAWVQDYLLDTARNLLAIKEDVFRYQSAVVNAIGAGDQRIWNRSQTFVQEELIWSELRGLKEIHGSLDKAIESYQLSKATDIGFETLRKLYFKVERRTKEKEAAHTIAIQLEECMAGIQFHARERLGKEIDEQEANELAAIMVAERRVFDENEDAWRWPPERRAAEISALAIEYHCKALSAEALARIIKKQMQIRP